MLKKWKESPESIGARAETKPLLPVLMDMAKDPQYAEWHPWAKLVIRRINGMGPEWRMR
jgi:hypothetical protein